VARFFLGSCAAQVKKKPRRCAAGFDVALSDYLFRCALFSIFSPTRSTSLPAPSIVLHPLVNTAMLHKLHSVARVRMIFFMGFSDLND
jgi:hypothetical protein